MFECDQCGKCCEQVGLSEIYKFLSDETGKCKFLKDNKCSIYYERPFVCRVDEMYEHYYKYLMTRNEYYELNYQGCKFLKSKEEI